MDPRLLHSNSLFHDFSYYSPIDGDISIVYQSVPVYTCLFPRFLLLLALEIPIAHNEFSCRRRSAPGQQSASGALDLLREARAIGDRVFAARSPGELCTGSEMALREGRAPMAKAQVQIRRASVKNLEEMRLFHAERGRVHQAGIERIRGTSIRLRQGQEARGCVHRYG